MKTAALLFAALLGTAALAQADAVNPPANRVSAVGFGTMSAFAKYPPGQQRLLAMRAAKLDALRNLAEQLGGVSVQGSSRMVDMASQIDSFRVSVDTLVRNARVVSITPIQEGNYEAVVETTVDIPLKPVAQAALQPVAAAPVAMGVAVPMAQANGANFCCVPAATGSDAGSFVIHRSLF